MSLTCRGFHVVWPAMSYFFFLCIDSFEKSERKKEEKRKRENNYRKKESLDFDFNHHGRLLYIVGSWLYFVVCLFPNEKR